ncbi:MAG: acyl-CoA synthetase [Campylobacterales bacterium]|nr:acyl-CoA synthetase [Campylobacterales bacterium]
MNIVVVDDSKARRSYPVDARLEEPSLQGKLVKISSESKEKSVLEILRAHFSGAKAVLYDAQNSALEARLETLDLSPFEQEDFSMMLFTSGTTGTPTGVLKTKHNLEADVNALVEKFGTFNPRVFVSTVPFIHVYGFLVGLMLPMRLGVDVVIKEHFLPHDLLEFAEAGSIVVTTPLYIKSLLRLDETKVLKETLFISSAGPLAPEIAQAFVEKFQTNLVQIFGSTETGSVAFRSGSEVLWTPFEGVRVDVSEEGMLHVSSSFIADTLWDETFTSTNGTIQTFDYVQFESGKFQLIGRSHQILKVAGKRVGVANIEEMLEAMPQIQRVVVRIARDEAALKDETLKIFVELKEPLEAKEIAKKVKGFLKNNTIPVHVALVEKIPTSATGKKILPVL